jgi:hypothetical protein
MFVEILKKKQRAQPTKAKKIKTRITKRWREPGGSDTLWNVRREREEEILRLGTTLFPFFISLQMMVYLYNWWHSSGGTVC